MDTLILLGIGLVTGSMIVMEIISTLPVVVQPWIVATTAIGLGAYLFTVLISIRKRIHRKLRTFGWAETTYWRYERWDLLAYSVFLSTGVVLAGGRINLTLLLMMATLFVLVQLAVVWASANNQQKEHWLSSLDAIPVLFFVSGFAALIYQVVWQRVLFSTFGINIESVTVVVSVFMFGLGLGALAGAWLQRRFPHYLLECFVAIEVAIGVFGLFSIHLIHLAGSMAPPDSLLSLVLIIYALLALPTMLMGATLPLLVTYLQNYYGNLGQTVGRLYAFNTLGSALASLLTVGLLFVLFGKQTTLVIAFLCNLSVAAFVASLRQYTRRRPASAIMPSKPHAPAKSQVSFPLAMLLSAIVGYASLSLEIIWFRIIGFMTAGPSHVFGLLLGVFLGGVAAGSLKVERLSAEGADLRNFVIRSLVCLVLAAYLTAPLVATLASFTTKETGVFLCYISIGLIAYFSGGIFPALCHMGITTKRAGQSGVAVGWMYFANIVGCTLGSLITGFFLFDIFSLEQNLAITSAIVLIPLAALLITGGYESFTPMLRSLTAASILIMMALYQPLYGRLIERMHSDPLKYVHENRSGIIAIQPDPEGDRIYGHGAYDGRFNIDPVVDSNAITRIYMLAALHPKPERVLEMGMSGGAATKVISMYKPVKQLISIEINPGYAEVIKNYPEIDSGLHHPKTTLITDDARRWLNRHPDEKFDVITMNTMYYWRSNSTNLLSKEFLEICKKHLKPGGIIYYNTTNGDDSIYTLAHVFKHVLVIQNFVAGSDEPFNVGTGLRRKNLLSFMDDQGKPVFNEQTPELRALLNTLTHEELPDIREKLLREQSDLWVITDDNMASEYKGRHFLPGWLYYKWFGKD